MSTKTTLFISAEQDLKSFFGDLFDKTDKRIRAAARHGISDAINIVRNTTWANVQSIPYKMTTPTKKYGVPLIEGIKTYMYQGEPTGVVHVLGNTRTNDGTWMLRFFAGGGAVRKTRGSVRGFMSLKAAYNSTMSQQMTAITNAIQQAIDEINK